MAFRLWPFLPRSRYFPFEDPLVDEVLHLHLRHPSGRIQRLTSPADTSTTWEGLVADKQYAGGALLDHEG